MPVYMTKTGYYCRGKVNGERYHEPCNTFDEEKASKYDDAKRHTVKLWQSGMLARPIKEKDRPKRNKLSDLIEIYKPDAELNKISYEDDFDCLEMFKAFMAENKNEKQFSGQADPYLDTITNLFILKHFKKCLEV